MLRMCIVLLLAVSVIQVHSQPQQPSNANDNSGFKFNYFFLWHSDATILNYLARNKGQVVEEARNRAQGQAPVIQGIVDDRKETSTGNAGKQVISQEEKDNFRQLEGLFGVRNENVSITDEERDNFRQLQGLFGVLGKL